MAQRGQFGGRKAFQPSSVSTIARPQIAEVGAARTASRNRIPEPQTLTGQCPDRDVLSSIPAAFVVRPAQETVRKLAASRLACFETRPPGAPQHEVIL